MFKKILSLITLALVAFVIWGAWDQITAAASCIFGGHCIEGGEFSINLFIVFLLIPEQLFMYYCAGKIFFAYMAGKQKIAGKKSSEAKEVKKISTWELARISFELNFVNHAIPSGGVSGLGYITWRLKNYGATAGQVSFMYILRYLITILANQTQTIFAIIFLIVTSSVPSSAYWMVWLVGAMSVGIIVAIAVLITIISSQKMIRWAAKELTAFINWLVKSVTFGKKKQVLELEKVNKYFMDLHDDFLTAKKDKKLLVKPVIWGFLYNFLEIATYEIVALSLGHGEIFPQIMVAEALGSLVGAVLPTPGGVGGYEGSMITVMCILGTNLAVASTVVIVTRVIVLLNTIISGYGFYQNAISKIGKADKKKIFESSTES
jgi:hypothetical protein cdivTM_07381